MDEFGHVENYWPFLELVCIMMKRCCVLCVFYRPSICRYNSGWSHGKEKLESGKPGKRVAFSNYGNFRARVELFNLVVLSSLF